MAAVKGSKQYHLKVVPYRPAYAWLIWGGGIILVLAMVASSFALGNFKGRAFHGDAATERDQLKVALAQTERELDQARQEVANLKMGAQVDRQASEGVRAEVINLKSQIAQLQEEISFYRGLMAPTENKRGLTIGSLEVLATGTDRTYEYKVVMQQLATNHRLLNGNLNFDVIGRQGDMVLSLPLKEVSDNVSYENIKLRFKYFQTIEGELVLPEGFEPERIELTAVTSGRNPVTIEKKFGWLVHE